MGVDGSSGESPAPPRKRAGSVRTALRKALAERRKVEGWTSAHEVSAAIALRFAEQVDQEDGAGMIRAAEQLAELMVKLGLSPRQGVNPSDGDATGRTPDERERLHVVMDGPPAVGDTAHG